MLGFELGTRDTVEMRRGSSHQRATAYLQGMFCLGTFSRGQRLSVPSPAHLCRTSVSPVLLQPTRLWLVLREVIEVSCSVSGETLSIAVHRQVGATFIQCAKGTRVLNNQLVAVFLRLHGQLSPPARATWSRREELAWLGMGNPGSLKFSLINLL